MEYLTLALATGFGLGLAPWMPGTWGSLPAAALGVYLQRFSLPIEQLESLAGGVGIVSDDVAAALATRLMLTAAMAISRRYRAAVR